MKRNFGLQLALLVIVTGILSPLSGLTAEQVNQAYELGEIVVSAPGSGSESLASVTRRIGARMLSWRRPNAPA